MTFQFSLCVIILHGRVLGDLFKIMRIRGIRRFDKLTSAKSRLQSLPRQEQHLAKIYLTFSLPQGTQPIRIIKLAIKPHTSFSTTKKVLDLKRDPGGVEISNHPGMVDRSHVESPLVQPGFAPLSCPTSVNSQKRMYNAGIFDTVFLSSPPSWRVMENAHSGSSGYNNC